MDRRDAVVSAASLLGIVLLSALITVFSYEETIYETYPDVEVPVFGREGTVPPIPAADAVKTPTAEAAGGVSIPEPLPLPPPTRPLHRPFVPGSGPYRLYPAPDRPPPGQDWLLFDYDDQAITHLSTGARVAAFCYFRNAEPTPVPGGYAGSVYRAGRDRVLLFVPLYYIDGRNAVHLVLNVPPEMDDQILANVVPFLNTRVFNPVEHCWRRK